MINKLLKTFSQLKFSENFINNIAQYINHFECEKQTKMINILFNNNIDLELLYELYNFNNSMNKIKFNYKIVEEIDVNKDFEFFINFIDDLTLKYEFKYVNLSLNENILLFKYIAKNSLKIYLDYKQTIIKYFNDFLKININDIVFELDNDELDGIKQQQLEYDEQILNIESQKPIWDENTMVNLNLINDNFLNKSINIHARVFNTSFKKTKSIWLCKIYVTDNDYAFILTKFIKDDKHPLFNIKKNDIINANIRIERDKYLNNELVGVINSFEIIKQEFINVDKDYQKQHIEFSVHTKMSSYDGVNELDTIKTYLENTNQTYIGFSDRYNVQCYPEIEKKFKNSNIKPIYGVEFEILQDNINAIINPKKINFFQQPIVVFDLETTGLNANFDDIIEFGAIKIYPNHEIEKIDLFLKPKNKLNDFTISLTHITNEMIEENGLEQIDGLKKIHEFIQESVLIAHNGYNFDFNFLNNKFMSYGLAPLNNIMVDTLNVSRAINNIKSHRLEKIAKLYKINYDPEIAHRADYDAEVLYHCWIKMTEIFENIHNIYDYKDLDIFLNKNLDTYKNIRGDYINIYAKNQNGIKRIYELVSISHTKNLYGRPTLFWDDINKDRKDIIVANNSFESELTYSLFNQTKNEILNKIKKYDVIFVPTIDNFNHLINKNEITIDNVKLIIKQLIDYAIACDKIFTCSANAYYWYEYEQKFYDVLTKIPNLNKRPHRFKSYDILPSLHYHKTSELINSYAFLKNKELINDLVINNGYKIISSIDFDNIVIIHKELFPPNIDGVDEKITKIVFENAKNLYGENLPKIVKDQIDKELNSLITNKFCVVYWVSHLLVKKSNEDGYIVGSRGSVGSSLVATLLNITDVNPLPAHYLCKNCKYSDFNVSDVYDGFDLKPKPCPKCNKIMYGEGHNIPFETFLGFKGDKIPDIDLNFSGIYQPYAHNFIKEMFGSAYAFRAGTISTIAEKTSYANAKEYFTITNKYYNYAILSLYASYCVDVKRTTGQHPGGIVVVPNEYNITDFTPYNFPADNNEDDWFTTHFAFEYIHDNLLKFDILGHDNPTILKKLEDSTNIKYKDVPTYDEKTMQLFTDISVIGIQPKDFFNETTGAVSLPEFGTQFVRDMLKSAQPKTFDDLIRISGLSHGTDVWLGNAEKLIKEGKTLKDVIACRDDIMNFLIANNLEAIIAFNIMEDVRKGKQIKPEYSKLLQENNIPQWYIDSANKIKYMFPKAHATAYVLHAWKFAWFKIYYPLEYYASYLSVRMNSFNLSLSTGNIENLKQYLTKLKNIKKEDLSAKDADLLSTLEVVYEARLRGIKFKNIDINKSSISDFLIDKSDNSLLCPLTCLDGLGESVALSIVEARKEPFLNKADFINRTKVTKLHITKLEELNLLDFSNEENNQMSFF